MPAPSTDQIRQIVTLRKQGLSVRAIGRELGFASATVSKYLRDFAGEGNGGIVTEPGSGPPKSDAYNKVVDSTDIDGSIELVRLERPASPEELAKLAGLDPKKWIPTHSRLNTWQGYGKVKTKAGPLEQEVMEKIQLFQSKASFKRIITENVEEAIAQYVREVVPPLPKKPSKAKNIKAGVEAQMLCWGFWDAHLGMYAWNKEVGEDFDMGIATRRCLNSIDDMIDELEGYPLSHILMPIGNDFMHFDSVKQTTTFGDHHLDCDSRYAKVFLGALQCLTYMVEQALERLNVDIELIYVPGNHDYTSSFALTVALDQRFLFDKRVTADLSMNPRKYRTHGGTLLGFDHGKDVKATSYPVIVATETKELWANSTWREIQIGHTHQRRETMYHGLTPVNGILVRTNPSLSNVDAWHHSKGFLGEPLKSVEAWRYDHTGYRGSHVVFARDAR